MCLIGIRFSKLIPSGSTAQITVAILLTRRLAQVRMSNSMEAVPWRFPAETQPDLTLLLLQNNESNWLVETTVVLGSFGASSRRSRRLRLPLFCPISSLACSDLPLRSAHFERSELTLSSSWRRLRLYISLLAYQSRSWSSLPPGSRFLM
jgi:hypothetical protein